LACCDRLAGALVCRVKAALLRTQIHTPRHARARALNSIRQARVVQRLDNAIHRINHYPADSVVCLLTFIHWIVIYPVDSVIQPLNNRGQMAVPVALPGFNDLGRSVTPTFLSRIRFY